MRLLNLLDRKIIAVIALMVIILLSIDNPIPNFSTLFSQKLNLNKAANYLCLSDDLPQSVPINLFENPYDPAANTNTIALYYRAQFFLAPRLLHLTSNPDQVVRQDGVQWFIGTNLTPEQAEQIGNDYQLNLIKVCGALFLYQK